MPLQFPEFKTVNLAEIGAAADREQANRMALRLQEHQLLRAQREDQEEREVRNVFARSGGDLGAAIPDVMRVSPNRGMALRKTLSEQEKVDLEKTKLKTGNAAAEFDLNKKKAEAIAGLSNAIVNEFDRHRDPVRANDQWQQMLGALKSSYGMETDKLPQQFDPDGARRIALSSLDVAKQLELGMKERELTSPVAMQTASGPAMVQAPKHAQASGSAIVPVALSGAAPYQAPSELERLTSGMSPEQRAQVEGRRLQKLTSHAPAAQTIVNTGEKSFLTQLGGKVGDRVVEQADQAEAAIGTLRNVAQIRQAMNSGQIILGPGADTRQGILRLGSAMGVTGASQDELLANTQAAMQGLARQELVAAQGMKGQGQITENERAILRKAESGTLDKLSMPELVSLTGALEKTAKFRVQRHEQNMRRLEGNPNAAAVRPFLETPAVPEQPATRPAEPKPVATSASMPDPARFPGKYMQSPDGGYWQSDGKAWKRIQR